MSDNNIPAYMNPTAEILSIQTGQPTEVEYNGRVVTTSIFKTPYRRFKFETQVDYGFGGSKNSWILSNRINYRLSKLIDLQLGWNFISLSHDDTIDGDNLNARVRLVGPRLELDSGSDFHLHNITADDWACDPAPNFNLIISCTDCTSWSIHI